MSAVGPTIVRQPALDGLRGLAVAGVLAFHGGYLRGGYLGVDAFFVLSGFLITTLLLVEVSDDGRVSLGRFWARRARRLLPALALTLLGVALYAVFLAKPEELNTIRGDAFATMGYVANWRAIATSRDYWALFREPSPLQHTWSLAIEEQFYLGFPLLFLVLVRGAARSAAVARVGAVAAGLAAVSFALAAWLYDPANPSRVYFGTDTRLGSILLGSVLAAILVARPLARHQRFRGLLEAAAIGSVVLIAVAWIRMDGSAVFLHRGGLLLSALGTLVVIAACVHPQRGVVARLLSVMPLRALGWISYGAYLWHWPVYVAMNETRTGWEGPLLFVARVFTTLVIATVSYRFVEQPIRHGWGTAAVWTRATPAVAVGLVVVLAVSTSGGTSDPTAVADEIRGGTSTTDGRRVLVVGNSIGMFMADEGLKQIRTDPPLDVLNIAEMGCRFLPQVTRERKHDGVVVAALATVCRDKWARAVREFRPDLVILVFSEPTDAEREIDGRWVAPCQPAHDDVFEAELRSQLRLLSSGGAEVLATTAPYAALPFLSEAWFDRNNCQNGIIRRVVDDEPNAYLADVFDWICSTDEYSCTSELDGVELRPDGVHFRNESARLFARWLLARTQDAGLLANVTVPAPTGA